MILEGGEGGLSEVVTNGTSLLFVRGRLLLLEGGPGTNMKGKRNTLLIHPPQYCDTGCLKKTSFCQNWPWQILLLIMRNPLSFFMTNAGDSFCNSYIYHLVGLHIRKWQSDSNTTSSLKNNKTIWDKFITCTHTFT